jgi:hypothetical protein
MDNVHVLHVIHVHGPSSLAFLGPTVAVMTVVRNGWVFSVGAF